MKRTLISTVALALIWGGAAMAQQAKQPITPSDPIPAPAQAAPAPAAPAPAPAASPAPAPTPAPAAKAPAAKAPAAAGLTVTRIEIAGSIENRQPSGIGTSFPSSQDKVYCYLELQNVTKDQTITYAWTIAGKETEKVTQQIRKAARWRTWGNKSVAGRKGDWKVEVLDESGAVLKSATFKVE